MKSFKFWVVACLLVAATVVLRVRGDVDKVPPSLPLTQMPHEIGGWVGIDNPLDDRVLEVLGKGSFLNRTYLRPGGDVATNGVATTGTTPSVGLFIGYFPTQRTGQAIHSPQHCLPGAGWVFEQSGVTTLNTTEGPAEVGEYIISNGQVKDEVLYWYRSHGRSIASDYAAKLYTLADSMRYGRTDAALVRVVTPLSPGETRETAHKRAVTFAENLNPLLPSFIPN